MSNNNITVKHIWLPGPGCDRFFNGKNSGNILSATCVLQSCHNRMQMRVLSPQQASAECQEICALALIRSIDHLLIGNYYNAIWAARGV